MKNCLLAVLVALCAALAAATLRAAAQSVMTGPIHDDPTVAPDKRQSADNNVSFPVDI